MSQIEWTDKTWNPVTGCTKVSRGCDNCYMYREYPRLAKMGNPGYPATPDVVTLLPERLEAPMKLAKPHRIFVCSMSDLFHAAVPSGFIDDIFRAMEKAIERRGHIFQVLTKRPGRALRWWEESREWKPGNGRWPAGIHLGTTVEEQKEAHRLDALAQIPAPRRFVSAEPLLTALDISRWLEQGTVNWVIVGGESGPEAREMELDWARGLRDQCQDTGVTFFLKQLGGYPDKRGGQKAILDGWRHTEQAPG